jgi:hypothetical protein
LPRRGEAEASLERFRHTKVEDYTKNLCRTLLSLPSLPFTGDPRERKRWTLHNYPSQKRDRPSTRGIYPTVWVLFVLRVLVCRGVRLSMRSGCYTAITKATLTDLILQRATTISLRDRAVKTRAPDDLNSLHWSRSSSTGAPAPLVQLHWYRATPNYFPTISLRDRAVKTRRSTGRRRRSTGTGQLWAGSFFCVVLACCADESVRSRVALYQRRGTREGEPEKGTREGDQRRGIFGRDPGRLP